VKTGEREFGPRPVDAIYIPRDATIEVSNQKRNDIAEFSSDVEGKYPVQVVR